MTWNYHRVVTLSEETINVTTCDGLEIKTDDLGEHSFAMVVVPEDSAISQISEIAPDGLEITFTTRPGTEITLVLPFNELDLHNALDIHLRDMQETV